MQILINRTSFTQPLDITEQIEKATFRLEKNINQKVDILNMKYNKYGDRTYIPKTGDEVTVMDEGITLFGGEIVEFKNKLKGRDVVLFELTARDYTELLNRRLIAETYQNETITHIVKDVVALSGSGITTNNVEEIIEELDDVIFDYQKPSDIIGDLADYVNCDWWVDESKDLHFKQRGGNTALYDLGDDLGNHIDNSLELKKSDSQIRNAIHVVGADYVGVETTDKTSDGDGVRVRFNLPYKYDEKPVIRVSNDDGATWEVQNVGVENLNAFGGTPPDDFSVLWNYGEKVITFENPPQGPDDTISQPAAIIEVTGKPLIPLRVFLKQPDSQRGVYEHKIIDRTLKSRDAVRRRAEAELAAYADTVDSASFRTYRSGLEVGTRMTVNSDVQGVSGESYIINKITTTVHLDTGEEGDSTKFEHSVKLSNTKAYEIIEFLGNLLRQGERDTGFIRNPATVLDTIITPDDAVVLVETMTANGNTDYLAEEAEIIEQLEANKDFNINPVWGPYTPTGVGDPNKTPAWDTGVVWPT